MKQTPRKLNVSVSGRLPEATIRLWEPGKLVCDQLQTKIYKIGGAYYAVTGDGRTQSEPIFVLADNLKEAKNQGKIQLELILDAAKRAAPPPPPPPMLELPDWVLDLDKAAGPTETQTPNTFDLEKLLNPTPPIDS
jgi:hypothetical protein